MDNQIKTSFIPHKPITTVSHGSDVRSAVNIRKNSNVGYTIFSFIAIIIFLATGGGYGAMFVWENQLNQQVVRQEGEMREAIDQFNDRFIAEATRLDTRIEQAKDILKNHVAPSALYVLLADYTRENIAFSSFAFEDTRDGGIKISAEGEATRFQSIILQSDSFGKSGYMRNVLFRDLKRNFEKDQIEFTLEAVLDPSLMLYKELITGSSNQ